MNDTLLECFSPSMRAPRDVPVTVALQYTDTELKTEFLIMGGSAGSSNGLMFHFYPAEVVSVVRPYEGPTRGGTTLTITGSGFRNVPELAVRFTSMNNGTESSNATAAITVPANFKSNGEITVATPRCPLGLAGGLFSVDVSSNGMDFTPLSEGPLFFFDTSEPFIDTISPILLHEAGGVVVAIHGSNIPDTYPNKLECRFGDTMPIQATRQSAELLTCVVPSHPPGRAIVTVTSYGQSLPSEEDLIVEFVGSRYVSSSWPTLGPASGGTAVTIRGTGFRDDETYLCTFGASKLSVASSFVNSSALVCVAPALSINEEIGKVRLQIWVEGDSYHYWEKVVGEPQEVTFARDGEVNSSFGSLSFRYHEDIDIVQLSPGNGPASGGTSVRISGTGFLNLEWVACRFGDGQPVPARVVNAWTIVCTVNSYAEAAGVAEVAHLTSNNASRAEKIVPVRVTTNGLDFSPSSVMAMFYYDDDVTVQVLTPERGPRTGGTRVVARGTGFRCTEYLMCKFGAVTVPAEYIASGAIACTAPAHPRLSVVPFSVTLNGQDFSLQVKTSVADGADGAEGPVFTYVDRAVVSAVKPRIGPTRGNTFVRVFGANFVNSTRLHCIFGTVQTSAEFVSPALITCPSPAVPVGTGKVHLEVSDQGSRELLPLNPSDGSTLRTNSGVGFVFMADAAVLAAFPASGPSSGGTSVSFTGFGFENLEDIRCRFGGVPLGVRKELLGAPIHAANRTAFEVPAEYVSPSEVKCVTPPYSSEMDVDGSNTGTVRVAVTLNGQDYGFRMAQFTYYPTPQVSVHAMVNSKSP